MVLRKAFRVSVASSKLVQRSVLVENRIDDSAILLQPDSVEQLTPDELTVLRSNKQHTFATDAYHCLGVLRCGSHGLYLMLITRCCSVARPFDGAEIFRVTQVDFVSLVDQASVASAGNGAGGSGTSDTEDVGTKLAGVKKLLNSGSFYFGVGYDVTQSALMLCKGEGRDTRFIWNRHMRKFFTERGSAVQPDLWTTRVIRGAVVFSTVYAGVRQAKIGVLSRISCERAGKRYLTRGVDDDGCVANFVETEQLIFLEGKMMAFLQTRGSVPVFWEQPGLQVGAHKVRLSRSHEATAPAFRRHIDRQFTLYSAVQIVNLLGAGASEKELSDAYVKHSQEWQSVDDSPLPLISFDFHARTKGGRLENLNELVDSLQDYISSNGYNMFNGRSVVSVQAGVVRTNCLDCLDRTNVVQMTIAHQVLASQLKKLGLHTPLLRTRFSEVFRKLWVRNGDAISRCYAGTGALKADVTLKGKRTKKGAFRDTMRSVSRAIQNNFFDGKRQLAMDVLLGTDVDESVLRASEESSGLTGSGGGPSGSASGVGTLNRRIIEKLKERESEFSTVEQLRLFVGTWNVNGGLAKSEEDKLEEWLVNPACQSYTFKEDALVSLDDNHHNNTNTGSRSNSDTSGRSTAATNDEQTPSPDVFVIGFQEVVDLTASNIVGAADQFNRHVWEKSLKRTINGQQHRGWPSYALVVSRQLVGLCICIFAKQSLMPFVRDVVIGTQKTGMRGMAANKGGIAARIRLYNTSICFVCAHLAAGQSNVPERNRDYQNIRSSVSFGKGRTIDTHDAVVWLGDFNYRVDLPYDECKQRALEGGYDILAEHDQLRLQRAAGKVFEGFTEGPLAFAPTYKYDLGTDVYDTSEKARSPAWCDRVLYQGKAIRQLLEYGRAELLTSDHRPVFAVMVLNALHIDSDARERILSQLISEFELTDGVTVTMAPVPPNVTRDHVELLMSKYGTILRVRLVAGCAHVCFETMDGARAAVAQDGSLNVLGAEQADPVFIEYARPRTGAYEGMLVEFDPGENQLSRAMIAAPLPGDEEVFDALDEDYSSEGEDEDDEGDGDSLLEPESDRDDRSLSGDVEFRAVPLSASTVQHQDPFDAVEQQAVAAAITNANATPAPRPSRPPPPRVVASSSSTTPASTTVSSAPPPLPSTRPKLPTTATKAQPPARPAPPAKPQRPAPPVVKRPRSTVSTSEHSDSTSQRPPSTSSSYSDVTSLVNDESPATSFSRRPLSSSSSSSSSLSRAAAPPTRPPAPRLTVTPSSSSPAAAPAIPSSRGPAPQLEASKRGTPPPRPAPAVRGPPPPLPSAPSPTSSAAHRKPPPPIVAPRPRLLPESGQAGDAE